MKNKLFLIIAIALIVICINSCKKKESNLFQGVIANKTTYALTIKVVDASNNKEIQSETLNPNNKISNVKLEEKTYNFNAYQSDGTAFYTITLNIDAVRNDRSYDGESVDWFCEFK